MPPRYAYWTILIDGKATAFRAKESEELLPTLNQLRRKNDDVALRYFSRGKLWDSPEQAEWAARNTGGFGEKRGADWRPGGTHKDPRARFDRKRKKDNAARTGSRDAGASRDDRSRPVDGDSRRPPPPGPSVRDRKSGWAPKPDRPRENSRTPKSFTDREQRGSRPPAKRFTTDRGEVRPLPKPRPEGDRPWSGKPREQDRRAPENEGRSEGRRPWTPKPRTGDERPWTPKPRSSGDRPWSAKPGGRPPQPPKAGGDARYGQKPDFKNRGENRPREDRPWNERSGNAKGRDEGRRPNFRDQGSGIRDQKKPWTPKPDKRDSTSGPRPPSTDRPRRDDWRTRPDRPAAPERRDERREAAPKPVREDRPDRPPSGEKIATRRKPPERG